MNSDSERELKDWSHLSQRLQQINERQERSDRDTATKLLELQAQLNAAGVAKSVDNSGALAVYEAFARQVIQSSGPGQGAAANLTSRFDSASRAALISVSGVVLAAVIAAGGNIAGKVFGPDSAPSGPIYTNGTGPYNNPYYRGPYPPRGNDVPPNQIPPYDPAAIPDCTGQIQQIIEAIKNDPNQRFPYINGDISIRCRLNESVQQQPSIQQAPPNPPSSATPRPGG